MNLYLYCNNDPANRIDPSGFDSYILYAMNTKSGDGTSTFLKQAEYERDRYKEEYDTECHIIGINSADDFMKTWNSQVGFDTYGRPVSVDAVQLIFHGSIDESNLKTDNGVGYLIMPDESRVVATNNLKKFNTKTDIEISSLDNKTMRLLDINACNSGHLDVKSNVANAFQDNNSIDVIMAWDGGSLYDHKTKKSVRPSESSHQPTWTKFVTKSYTWGSHGTSTEVPTRTRRGIVYLYKDSEKQREYDESK